MSYAQSIKVWGLSLMAMLAFGAIAAASASASQPKAEPEGGTFPVTVIGFAVGGTLETVKGRKVECSSNTSTGSLSNATMITGIKVLFKDCTAKGPFATNLPCKSVGKASGEIETVSLKGTLFYIKTGSSEVGVLLQPESGTTFSSFTCGPVLNIEETITVRGSVVGVLTPVNTLTNAFTLTFTQTKGVQSPIEYLNASCAKTKATLETEGKGKGLGSETWAFDSPALKRASRSRRAKKSKSRQAVAYEDDAGLGNPTGAERACCPRGALRNSRAGETRGKCRGES